MTPADEATFITLWLQGLSQEAIAQHLGIPIGTVKSRAHTLAHQGKIQARPRGSAYPRQQAQARALPEGIPPDQTGHTVAHPSTPPADPTPVHPGTPPMPRRHTEDHPGTPPLPAPQSTPAHPSVPLSHELGARLLALLPELEILVARERDRQRLVSTPVGTPQHTVKKTYVVEALYVDLIERYATAEGVERKDVVNLAFHEFFERRQYLPSEG